MELTQADYDARKQRWNDGLSSDEDRRLCKEYERQGFTESRLKPASVDPGDQPDAGDGEAPLTRPPINANKDAWVAFAVAVNSRRGEGDEPIGNPTDQAVTKQDLIDAYGHLGEPQA